LWVRIREYVKCLLLFSLVFHLPLASQHLKDIHRPLTVFHTRPSVRGNFDTRLFSSLILHVVGGKYSRGNSHPLLGGNHGRVFLRENHAFVTFCLAIVFHRNHRNGAYRVDRDHLQVIPANDRCGQIHFF